MSKPAILEALNVEAAAAVIITLDNPEKKLLVCEALAQYGSRINIAVKIVSLEEKAMLRELPISYMVDGKEVVAEVLVNKIMECRI